MESKWSRSIWILLSSGSDPLDVAGPHDVFYRTNECAEVGRYALRVVGARSRVVYTEGGLGFVAQATLDEAAAEGLPHTIVVGGGAVQIAPQSDEAYAAAWLREHADAIPRICSVCSGAFTLGEAGLLGGRQATTHWSLLSELQSRFPKSHVVDDGLFTHDGKIWTSAGLSAGMDMSLAIVEEDFGHEVSLAVARLLVLFLRRSANQPQFSAALAGQQAERRVLRELQVYVADHLRDDLTVERLAKVCGMSPRNLSRVFKKELGMTLGAFVRNVRLDEARRLLDSTELGVQEVAPRVGLRDESTLRRWFVRHLGVSPTQYRDRFRAHTLRSD